MLNTANVQTCILSICLWNLVSESGIVDIWLSIFLPLLMTGLVHVVAHYYKQALTLPSEVECHSSMVSSRNEVRVFPTIFPTK